ncbi:hypothetical protein PPERSA_08148 [Pseudocohnilembus persalinus]|uniref:Dynein regulatory complex subunit 3 n=1 Tax=Pseudocohnilembus persalinus TaxID=266149 RepID=A0A0V0QMD5_PSEPJ|nr:hypothetical protein PPERSA_08148 [Pseudocohnilembus persalinus]|eukprot:KRX03406.1 hypothetical protein PPERSA_08148 [Pseudocohnilembus persalinus]
MSIRTTVVTTTSFGKKKGQQNSVIPNVIDAKLIVEALNAEQDKQYEGGIMTLQNVVFQNLSELSLSFRNIMEIQNLQSLEKLQKLQLDNNLICKIQNIGHLVNLRWLDLSFNSIEVIEGLENLSKLEDLSLYDNKISQLGGLENCQQLNVFSIGNNRIGSYDVITSYFGYNKQSQVLRFKKLQVLNVAGNPFTKDTETSYRELIIAHLPGLKYLDYQFIDEQDRKKIRDEDDKIANDTVKQDEYFQQMQKDNTLESGEQKKKKERQDSRMDLLDDMHNEMVKIADIENIIILKPESVEAEIKKFQDKVVGIIQAIQKEVIEQNRKKQIYVSDFEHAQKERIHDSESQTIQLINQFEKKKKHVFRDNEKVKYELEQTQDRGDDKGGKRQYEFEESKKRLQNLLNDAEKLKDDLIGVEIQLDEEIRSNFQEFKDVVSKFITDEICKEITLKGTQKMEEAINDITQKFSDIAKIEIDKHIQNPPSHEEQEDLPEEEQERIDLLDNKDSITVFISSIKDGMTDKSGEKMQAVETQINKDFKDYETSRMDMMYERNRQNIKQINNQIDNYIEEINNEILDTQNAYESE